MMNLTVWRPPGSRMNSLGLTSVQVTTSVCRLIMVAWPRLPAGSKPVASIRIGIPPEVRHYYFPRHRLPRLGLQFKVRRGDADAQVLRPGLRRSRRGQRYQDRGQDHRRQPQSQIYPLPYKSPKRTRPEHSREPREIIGEIFSPSIQYGAWLGGDSNPAQKLGTRV